MSVDVRCPDHPNVELVKTRNCYSWECPDCRRMVCVRCGGTKGMSWASSFCFGCENRIRGEEFERRAQEYRAERERVRALEESERRLRAAVDAALALHRPVGLAPHMFCDYCIDLDGAHDTRPVPYPCATVRALTPVADPDPHTTSDKEQQ